MVDQRQGHDELFFFRYIFNTTSFKTSEQYVTFRVEQKLFELQVTE